MAITKITCEGEATRNSGAKGNIKPNGHGKMTYVDGADEGYRYEGDFAHNDHHGQGKSYRADGTTVEYEGDWMESTWHGQGTLYHPDGTIERTGTWVHGEPADEAGVD